MNLEKYKFICYNGEVAKAQSNVVITQALDTTRFNEIYEEAFFVHFYEGPLQMELYHAHQGYEINLCIKGNCTLKVFDKQYAVRDQTMSILNNEEFHLVVGNDDSQYQRLVFFFNDKFIENISTICFDFLEVFKNRFEGFCNVTSLDDRNFYRILDICDEIHYCFYHQSKANNAMLELLLGQLLIKISTIYKNKDNYVEISNKLQLKRAQPMIDFIRKNISQKLQLEDLCREFFMSKSTLIDIFNKAVQLSPKKFIIYERIAKAKRLLKSGLPAAEVCIQTGFNDSSHFSRTFHTIVGKTPKQFANDC